jgi:hypothetical protein
MGTAALPGGQDDGTNTGWGGIAREVLIPGHHQILHRGRGQYGDGIHGEPTVVQVELGPAAIRRPIQNVQSLPPLRNGARVGRGHSASRRIA